MFGFFSIAEQIAQHPALCIGFLPIYNNTDFCTPPPYGKSESIIKLLNGSISVALVVFAILKPYITSW